MFQDIVMPYQCSLLALSGSGEGRGERKKGGGGTYGKIWKLKNSRLFVIQKGSIWMRRDSPRLSASCDDRQAPPPIRTVSDLNVLTSL